MRFHVRNVAILHLKGISDLETVNGVLPLILNVYDTGNQNFKEIENLELFHYGYG
ncbi:sulfur transfer protein SufE [Chryseobacterium flavum]